MSIVIHDPVDVTPQLLAELLRLDRSAVEKVDVELYRVLAVSRVARLRVRYRETGRGPATLFLKLPKPGAGVTTNEIDFYNEVAALDVSQSVPHCYHAAADPASTASHLLLKDLTETHFQTVQETAPRLDQSRKAVVCLARMHARWWSAPEVGVCVGEIFDDAWLQTLVAELERSVEEFIRDVDPSDMPD